ncbi:MAG: plastocyanin [Arenicella sp.]|jgi:plastocyanin
MKKTLLFVMSVAFLSSGYAQTTIENGNFDAGWDNVSGSEDEPFEWNSLKTGDPAIIAAFAPVVAFKELTAGIGGSNCIRLKVILASGVNANGLLTNGRVHVDTNPDNGYVFTQDGTSGNETPFTGRPDSLVFWYQHTPQNGDKSKFEIILHDNSAEGRLPETGSTAHWVGKSRAVITGTTSGWTRYAQAFTYFNCNTPDYLLSVISAGDSTIAELDTELHIDNIELVYNTVVADVAPSTTQNIDIGVDGADLTITEVGTAGNTAPTSREWKFSSTAGGPYASFGPTETGTTYTPNFAGAGIYYVVCESDFGCGTIVSNEVEIVVVDPGANTVTVTPSATQSILTDEDGNLLTATETPSAATSREWMSSMTSGSGYVAIAPAETGTTYTPNFPTVGTYYIVCESDFAGDVQMSNEVQIDVPSSIGIDEIDLKFFISTQGQQITLNYENTGEAANFVIFSLNGQKVHEQAINSTVTNIDMIDAKGVYVYRLISGDRIITGKLQF